MKNIIKLEPNNTTFKKIKVAAYARVSTDEEKQLNSLESQKSHYEKYVKSNPLWEFAGIYFDEGISGTKKEKRAALLSLIEDCKAGKINHIITKSVSRFARNLTDCLEIVRFLTSVNVSIYFEQENIDTSTMNSEFMLSILSSIAELEAKSVSQNAKWSVKRRFQNGTFKQSMAPYGYDTVDGNLVVNPKESEIIKRIFFETLQGSGVSIIAKGLNQDKIKPKRAKEWSSRTINDILTNEKYKGDTLLQKTFTDDNYTRFFNKGEQEQYYIENSHESIISREDYEATQNIIYQRGKEKGNFQNTTKYLNTYFFTGKIECNNCGKNYKRRIYKKNQNQSLITWSCSTHIKNKNECDMLFLKEENMQIAIINLINKLIFSIDILIKPFLEKLKIEQKSKNFKQIDELETKLFELNEQRKKLLMLRSKKLVSTAHFNLKNNSLLSEENQIKQEIKTLSNIKTTEYKRFKESEKLYKFLSKSEYIDEFEDKIFLDFIGKIIVLSNTKICISMKCGLNLCEEVKR